MARSPRQYQQDAIIAARDALASGKRGVVMEMPTGTGKGLVIAHIAMIARARGKRVLVTVNRDNLIEQLFESLVEQGLYPVKERGMDKASPMSDCVIGSIQTMTGDRLKKWNPDHFHLVICDECHFCAADSFKETLNHFQSPQTYHLGVTATLERHDKKGLWNGYEDVAYSMSLIDAINEGWLVGFDFVDLPVPIEISDQQASKKMWTEKDEGELFSTNNYLPRLFAASAAECAGKHALMFWPNCDSSREADAHFRGMGIESFHVDGDMRKDDIREILEWFKKPGHRVLHNADLLSYGYDNPIIDCVGIMRVSRSVPMLKQRLGRGTRPACVVDGLPSAEARREAIANSPKPLCKVLDLMLQLGDVANRFADATSLITADPDEREYIREEQEKAGRPLTMEEMRDKLKAKRETDKEEQLAKLAEDAANAARKKMAQNKIYVRDILDNYNPAHKPATPAFENYVRNLIRKNGFDVAMGTGPFTASQIMKIKLRVEEKLAKLQ